MASSARIDELRKKFEENPRRYFAPLANEYRKAGDVDQAISICREYLPQQPGHMSGHIVYGQALYEARQFEEAKTVFETALTLDPENLIALRHLGDISLIVGDAEGAKAWYRRVLEADPRNEEIQAQLASLEIAAEPGQATSSQQSAAPSPPAASMATPPTGLAASSAPTVVVSAIKAPITAVPASSADTSPTTLELDVSSAESAPTISSAPLELESPVAGGSHSAANQGAAESSSVAGLETTSMATEPPPSPPSLSNTPTVELVLDTISTPAPRSDAPTTPSVSTSSDTAAADSPPPIPSELAATAANVPPPIPSTFGFPSPDMPPPIPSASASAQSETAATASAPPPQLLEFDPVASGTASPPPAESEASVPDVPLLDMEQIAAVEASVSAPDSGPFVTETMAELYLQQGHTAEALRVYSALLEQRPGDSGLRAKVASLQPRSGDGEVSSRVPESEQVTPRTAEPSIREILGVLAMRRPGSRASVPPNGAPATETRAHDAPPAAAVPGPAAEVTGPPSPTSAAPGSVSTLFGSPAVAPADEDAARALALAFAETNGAGGAEESSGDRNVAGVPARRASNELSLDAVFGGDNAVRAAPSTFSFDQFFSPRASVHEGSAGTASGGASTGSPDDVAHFTKWLEGLKRR